MRTLKINLFYKCTAVCAHCRFSCTMEQEAVPDYETPYAAAKQLKENFGLDRAVVLGGEPSIFAAQTQELLHRLSVLGVGTRLETNACWAASPEAAEAFLKPLQESRTRVMLSLDGFHTPYVPYENVVNAVRMCHALEIPFTLEIPYLDLKRKTHPIDLETRHLAARIQKQIPFKIPVCEENVIFISRAAYTFGSEFAAGRGLPAGPCVRVPWWGDSEINSTDLLILEPGGWLTKGCGIAIGNVLEQDLIAMLCAYDAEKHPIFSVLLREGPLGLARMAEKFGFRMQADYADQCHLCHAARQWLKSEFPSILQPDAHYIN